MTNEELELGASILYRAMKDFFSDQANREKFEAWKMQKEAKENG